MHNYKRVLGAALAGILAFSGAQALAEEKVKLDTSEVRAGGTPVGDLIRVVTELATAFGSTVRAASGDAPLVVLGRDSRPSGPAFAAAATAGLLAAGCRVVDLGVVPTPTVGMMVSDLDASGGLERLGRADGGPALVSAKNGRSGSLG